MSEPVLLRTGEDIEPPPSPTDKQVRDGLHRFVEDVRQRYGSSLRGIYLFGSRARGDNGPESDADVAVVIADGGWSAIAESIALANETFEILIDLNLDIQPRAIAESRWCNPDLDDEPWLVRNIVADARNLDFGL